MSTPRCTPEVHDAVIVRDKVCFMYRIDSSHQCRTIFGAPHAPDHPRLLTVDGVKANLRMGRRSDHSRVEFLVAMCAYENNRPPTRETRQLERSYLTALYPEVWS